MKPDLSYSMRLYTMVFFLHRHFNIKFSLHPFYLNLKFSANNELVMSLDTSCGLVVTDRFSVFGLFLTFRSFTLFMFIFLFFFFFIPNFNFFLHVPMCGILYMQIEL